MTKLIFSTDSLQCFFWHSCTSPTKVFSYHLQFSSFSMHSSGNCVLLPCPVSLFCLPLHMERRHSDLHWKPSGFGICSLSSLLTPGCLVALQRADQERATGNRNQWSPDSLQARYLVPTSDLGIRGFCWEGDDLKKSHHGSDVKAVQPHIRILWWCMNLSYFFSVAAGTYSTDQ